MGRNRSACVAAACRVELIIPMLLSRFRREPEYISRDFASPQLLARIHSQLPQQFRPDFLQQRAKCLRLRADSARNMWLGWLAVAHGILKKCVGRHGRITLMTFQPIRNSCVVIIAWRRSVCVQGDRCKVKTHRPTASQSFFLLSCVMSARLRVTRGLARAAAAQGWPADLDASLQHSMPTV